MIFVAFAVEVTPTPWMTLGRMAVVIMLILSIAIEVEERIARRIQQEIDALDSL